MLDIVSLVPGFNAALAGLPGTLGAYADLVSSLDRGVLSARSRAEIGLIVANRVRCDYCRWVMERLAAQQEMTEEEIFFAGIGISCGRREAAIARLVRQMVSGNELDPRAVGQQPAARPFGQSQVAEIVAQVALAVLTCTVLQSIAPHPVGVRKEA